MFSMTRMDEQAELMGRMAERAGADLGAALIAGAIDGQSLRSAYFRCYACGATEACRSHLGTEATTPPDFCRNADLLQAIRD